MRIIAAILIAVGIPATPALADQSKECILKAASVLPHNFKTVGKPTTRSAPHPNSMLVDINITAAGQKDRWTYLCMWQGGTTLVQRVAR